MNLTKERLNEMFNSTKDLNIEYCLFKSHSYKTSEDLISDCIRLSKETNYQFIKIDPYLFFEDENILEIFVSTLFQKFKMKLENSNFKCDYEQKRKILELFHKVYQNTKIIIGKNIENLYDELIEELSIKGSATNFKSNLYELLNEYSEFVKESDNYVIVIDNSSDYDYRNIAEKIKIQSEKYFKLPNIVVLTNLF